MTSTAKKDGPNIGAIVIVTIAVGINLLLSKLMANWSYSWLPPQVSIAAPYVDDLFALETGIGTFIFLGCSGAMGWSILFNRADKYDESDGEPIEGNTKLEIVWTLIPLLVVFAIAYYTIQVNHTLQNLGPKQKYTIGSDPSLVVAADPSAHFGPVEVIGRQWSWEFIYPNGVHSSELHVPVNLRTNLRLISEDVLHSFYVPAFRLKQDLIPGSVISYSFTPTMEGIFRLRDAMFSGAYFSQNQSHVIVESEEEFRDWLQATSTKPLQPGYDPGRPLYERRLDNGDRGWATVPPAPAPMVHDPGDPNASHDA